MPQLRLLTSTSSVGHFPIQSLHLLLLLMLWTKDTLGSAVYTVIIAVLGLFLPSVLYPSFPAWLPKSPHFTNTDAILSSPPIHPISEHIALFTAASC
ncbi:hypothetical protein P280DRAFT_335744 [Massarina eburnea CBS 473.64]|uniref:Uncharacterized protein n=1 Tax=Massarina eburnea CBS 473.64 TaxID=1395130 RepID=A0A6A6RG37_9PLEO|nr:hypothetical protein P280DRAFT_335744 [Massarina eburnea CBS 473.64]